MQKDIIKLLLDRTFTDFHCEFVEEKGRFYLEFEPIALSDISEPFSVELTENDDFNSLALKVKAVGEWYGTEYIKDDLITAVIAFCLYIVEDLKESKDEQAKALRETIMDKLEALRPYWSESGLESRLSHVLG